MLIRSITAALLPALLLVGCNAPAASSVQNVASTTAVGANTAVPLTAQRAPTTAVLPSPIIAPTSAPAPTADRQSPTFVPTSLPEPTSVALAPTSAPISATSAPAPTTGNEQQTTGEEILFLRKGTLTAFDVATRKERALADNVTEFAATPDGTQIAIVRGVEGRADIWVVQRNGSNLRQITNDARREATLGWAPDGSTVVFASSSSATPYEREWQAWSSWCIASEVRVVNIADESTASLGAGCDPTLSPDGKRIAYATPPTQNSDQGSGRAVNSIRLINRAGQNGWDFAKATGAVDGQNAGQVVYAPTFSQDGKQIIYHRYIGMRVEVDIVISEIGGSFASQGKPMHVGAGWLLPARFAPNSRRVAITDNNYSDARGFGGYDNWSVTLVQLDGSREVAMPDGPLQVQGQALAQLPRAQQVAWSPDGTTLAVELPPGWRADAPANEPLGVDANAPGEVWLWTPGVGRPGSEPQPKLITGVDAASPLAWLPAPTKAALHDRGFQLIYPARR